MVDKVVQLKAPSDEPSLKVVETDYRECRHSRYEVHRDLPKVFCRDCDEMLDPYWVLRQIASTQGQRHYYVAQMKREAERMEKLVKRQMETRKSAHRKDADAMEIQRLQSVQRGSPETFHGDIEIADDETSG